MDIIPLIIKAAASGALVLGISLIAERVSPRIAGVISGAPMGALISYFFLGREEGVTFVIESVPHGIASIAGVLTFAFIYYATSVRVSRYNAAISTVVGLCGYGIVAFALSLLHFTISSALGLSVAIALLAGYLLRHAVDIRVVSPVRMTLALLAWRAGFAAVLVVSVVSLGKALGPVWAGVLIGFPMTFLPSLLIVQLTYTKDHAYALLQGFPMGIGAVLCYMISLPLTFPALGVNVGSLVSLSAGLAYLAGLSIVVHIIKQRRK